jgi:hypothetical protein
MARPIVVRALTFEQIHPHIKDCPPEIRLRLEEQLIQPKTCDLWEALLTRITILNGRGCTFRVKFTSGSWYLATKAELPATYSEALPVEIIYSIGYDPAFTEINRSMLVNDGGHYKLFPLPIPPYISIAHELLHLLLRLDFLCRMENKREIYDWCKAEGNEETPALDKFKIYLKSKVPAHFLTEEEKDSLCNYEDQFMREYGLLEEMCVILNNDYECELPHSSFPLSETLFMREHYHNDKLICWSHSLWEVITVVREQVSQFRSPRKKIILNPEKVTSLLTYFDLVCPSREEIGPIIEGKSLIGMAP